MACMFVAAGATEAGYLGFCFFGLPSALHFGLDNISLGKGGPKREEGKGLENQDEVMTYVWVGRWVNVFFTDSPLFLFDTH